MFLADIEERQLHLQRGFPSMYAFCASQLDLLDGKAYRRIEAARLGRRFPIVLELVAAGTVTLTALNLLARHINEDNHAELLRAAAGRTKRQILELRAARFPKPDPKTSIRKFPLAAGQERQVQAAESARPAESARSELPPTAEPAPAPEATRLVLEPPRRSPVIEPIAAQRYAVKFAAPRSLVDKLEELDALRSHRSAEVRALERVLEDAVDLLLAHERKKRFAVGVKPRRPSKDGDAVPADSAPSRHIPAAVRREVYERDGGRCTFQDPETGRRCGTRHLLTFEHIRPFALGGEHTVDAVTLLCAAHNRLAADQVFGRDFMAGRVERARRSRTGTVASDSPRANEASQLCLVAASPDEEAA